ncbi:D-amino acid dehydrogenase [Rhizobium ruizarguesonis]|uniref:D-amino acid dehydrogenase n=1 Tax=Rhizobium ruizarguesonis TaxID=2081791 RepID=UPI0013C276CA|nr:D-amino acid dehydrogenase [Rhizobium ruizarguesonis]NEI96528.1 D-amino acid dehydrogenase [Rhizobium ruizarguesonis]NEJ33849.1 D-amino acid dehydrogenase [Rhizobium ruizarguesonis]
MPHILILGAGITGMTTAYALLKRGYRVTVIDRNRYAAMETSFANGGQLSASNAEVWNSWSTVSKGMSWMLRRDAPLLLNPTPTWHKYSWLAEFLACIPNYEDSTVATTRLAIESRRHLFAMAQDEGIDFDLERRGILHVYYDREGFEGAAKVNELLKKGGLDRRSVSAEEIRSIEPALSTKFFGGFFTPSDSTGDIHKFTTGLAEACKRHGATFVFDADVLRIKAGDQVSVDWRPTNDSKSGSTILNGDAVVVCAGVGSRQFAAMLGDRVNVYPVKGYSITVNLEDEKSKNGAPWVSLLDDRAKIVTSRLGEDRFRVAGTAEFNGIDRDIRSDRIRPLTDWVRSLFPSVSTSRVVPWAGLRPMMPNMLPIVRQGKRPRVFYNTGHGHLGWTLSAATSELVSDLIDSSCLK